MVLQGVPCLVALCMEVHRVVLLPAIRWFLLRPGVQVVHHLGVLCCRMGPRVGNLMSSSMSVSPHRGPHLGGCRPGVLYLLR